MCINLDVYGINQDLSFLSHLAIPRGLHKRYIGSYIWNATVIFIGKLTQISWWDSTFTFRPFLFPVTHSLFFVLYFFKTKIVVTTFDKYVQQYKTISIHSANQSNICYSWEYIFDPIVYELLSTPNYTNVPKQTQLLYRIYCIIFFNTICFYALCQEFLLV